MASWVAKEETILNYLLPNMSKEILRQVNTWVAIEGMFASKSHAKISSTRMALTTTTKGTASISEYFAKMKSLSDEMMVVG
jgi:hypothetical protein